MIPRLYIETVSNRGSAETLLNFNGYGFFDTCSKCIITEERNGEFTLDMTISDTDRLAQTVMPNMYIGAKPNPLKGEQFFEIYEIKEQEGKITIKANHISYLIKNDILNMTRTFDGTSSDDNKLGISEGEFSRTIEDIMTRLFDDSSIPAELLYFNNTHAYKFSFSTDITDVRDFSYTTFYGGYTFGDMLSGTRGSILDVYGGEYEYDNFHIYLKKRRGSATNKIIRYGANLGEYSKSMSTDNMYTHVCCYAKVRDKSGCRDIIIAAKPKRLVDTTLFEKVKLVDVTNELNENWDTVSSSRSGDYAGWPTLTEFDSPTVDSAQMRDGYGRIHVFCNKMNNKVPVPNHAIDVSIKISLPEALDSIQDINLCDTVKVMLKDGSLVTSKITKVKFNSITERYTYFEVGTASAKITDFFTKKRR